LLADEFRAYVISFALVAVPATLVVAFLPNFFGELITGRLPHESAAIAGRALPWLVPAAFGQLLAALAASALAARDSYLVAAAGFAAGAIGGVLMFILLAADHGLISLAWGLALNAGLAVALPAAALVLRGGRFRRGRVPVQLRRRLWRLLYGAAVPLAVQGIYVIGLRFAAGTGTGNVTSLSYAYLLAAMFVSATAFSLSLIAAAPLTRRGVDAEAAADHVVHTAWIALAIVGAATGLVALVGGRVVTAALGDAYAGHVGDQLGRLVVYLSPWMVAWAAFSITYPLLFVMHRTRLLVPIAVGGVLVDIPISIAGRAWWGLSGVTFAMGISMGLIVLGLMAALSPRTLSLAVVGLLRLSALVGAATALAFGGASLLLAAVPAAAAGLALYALILLAVRQLGLAEAWHHVRALR
jgi:O-antigen/teichoic acid export membrane protein